MIKNKYAAFALFLAAFLLFWNLLDYLYSTFITGSGYHCSAGTDLALPVAVAVVVGFLLFLRNSKK